MKRREFVKICASAVAGVSASPELLAKGDRELHSYNRAVLVDRLSREPIKASTLEVGETYLFQYPYISTPCFLMNLGRRVNSTANLKTRDGKHYRGPAGVGPKQSIVAFSAICAHQMSHPAPSVSFINYRHGKARFENHAGEIVEDRSVIYCCSEKSVYDPAKGAQVLGGPAPEPLAAIALEYVEAEDAIYANATIGGEMFNRYFDLFSQRLILDHGRTDIQQAINETTELMPLKEYCRNLIMCNA